ncbi:MAG TPA: hypothetical protein VGE92_03225, partial [Steroidobacteraceae bacterium]
GERGESAAHQGKACGQYATSYCSKNPHVGGIVNRETRLRTNGIVIVARAPSGSVVGAVLTP